MSDIKLACDVAEQVRAICDKHGNQPGELINILHEAQHLHGYLPEEMQRLIAAKLNVPVSRVYGGGQPLHHGNSEVLYARANALYREDAQKPLRKSHENPYIKTLYEEYLGKPLSETAERLLHTHYFNKAID